MINIGVNDDAGVANLTWTYVGGADITDGRTIMGFSAKSLFGPGTTTDFYASQAHGSTPGGVVQNVGPVQVPTPLLNDPIDAPEPMSIALLGGGLTAMCLFPRRFLRK